MMRRAGCPRKALALTCGIDLDGDPTHHDDLVAYAEQRLAALKGSFAPEDSDSLPSLLSEHIVEARARPLIDPARLEAYHHQTSHDGLDTVRGNDERKL